MQNESVNPPHYKKSIQTCDAILSQQTHEENIGYLKGAGLKHLFRFGQKHGTSIDSIIMDLEKCLWYLKKLLNYLKALREDGMDINQSKENVTNLFKKDDNE
tara:strand:- start:947 stop:1252 length:306 start_codon:yes stop_codon:yes gene_type:complete